MAVENKYVDANTVLGNTAEPGANGHELIQMVATVEIAAADDDGSVYRFFKNVPSSFKPIRCTVMCDAITGGTDYDLGLYATDLGAVADKDVLMDGQTLATASKSLNGLGIVDIADIGAKKSLAELLGLTPTTAKPSYDIALTGNTVGTGAGTVTIIMEGYAA